MRRAKPKLTSEFEVPYAPDEGGHVTVMGCCRWLLNLASNRSASCLKLVMELGASEANHIFPYSSRVAGKTIHFSPFEVVQRSSARGRQVTEGHNIIGWIQHCKVSFSYADIGRCPLNTGALAAARGSAGGDDIWMIECSDGSVSRVHARRVAAAMSVQAIAEGGMTGTASVVSSGGRYGGIEGSPVSSWCGRTDCAPVISELGKTAPDDDTLKKGGVVNGLSD
ncbi:hypothetical protein ACLOJK_015084 [Asimina triloba]